MFDAMPKVVFEVLLRCDPAAGDAMVIAADVHQGVPFRDPSRVRPTRFAGRPSEAAPAVLTTLPNSLRFMIVRS